MLNAEEYQVLLQAIITSNLSEASKEHVKSFLKVHIDNKVEFKSIKCCRCSNIHKGINCNICGCSLGITNF